MPGEAGSGRLADLGPALQEWKQKPLLGEGFGTRVVGPERPGSARTSSTTSGSERCSRLGASASSAGSGSSPASCGGSGKEAKEDDSDRGWLLVAIAASVAAFAVGMFTYDAFSFIQVTFLMFIFVGLGAALIGERPMPLARRSVRSPDAPI